MRPPAIEDRMAGAGWKVVGVLESREHSPAAPDSDSWTATRVFRFDLVALGHGRSDALEIPSVPIASYLPESSEFAVYWTAPIALVGAESSPERQPRTAADDREFGAGDGVWPEADASRLVDGLWGPMPPERFDSAGRGQGRHAGDSFWIAVVAPWLLWACWWSVSAWLRVRRVAEPRFVVPWWWWATSTSSPVLVGSVRPDRKAKSSDAVLTSIADCEARSRTGFVSRPTRVSGPGLESRLARRGLAPLWIDRVRATLTALGRIRFAPRVASAEAEEVLAGWPELRRVLARLGRGPVEVATRRMVLRLFLVAAAGVGVVLFGRWIDATMDFEDGERFRRGWSIRQEGENSPERSADPTSARRLSGSASSRCVGAG
jgi:hypothetical protein